MYFLIRLWARAEAKALTLGLPEVPENCTTTALQFSTMKLNYDYTSNRTKLISNFYDHNLFWYHMAGLAEGHINTSSPMTRYMLQSTDVVLKRVTLTVNIFCGSIMNFLRSF